MSFVGIGMGAIQAGLFLPRAQEAGMTRTVLVRRAAQARSIMENGSVAINVADSDGIHTQTIDNLQAYELGTESALAALVDAEHISVAVSSVADYVSLAPLLSEAIARKAAGAGPKAVIYTSENTLDAADQMEAAISPSEDERQVFQAVDTVIGKMSRTIRDQEEIEKFGLFRGAPGLLEAWLVESYDDIYVTAPDESRTAHGLLPRLSAYENLVPFERAKLNGHNAAHASLAYIGRLLGLPYISEVIKIEQARQLAFEAFENETGRALIAKYESCAPLFSSACWRAHAEDLFNRMANPWLRDDCERAGRDTTRKLGWDDRLVGTIRMIEGAGFDASRWYFALHAALEASGVKLPSLATTWRRAGANRSEVNALTKAIRDHRPAYEDWRRALHVQAAAE